MATNSADIIPRKTVLGSYIIMRHIATGGMGSVWEGWLNPYAELGTRMLSGGNQRLRALAGIKSDGEELTGADARRIAEWVNERTTEFIESPDVETQFGATYAELLTYIAPHRRIAGDFRRAIKILDPELAGNQKLVKRFLKEIQIQAQTLDHPNVAKVVEGGNDGATYYAVLEYVESVDLERASLTIPEATHIIRQALEGLIHAHERGILHRDIKPANLLATKDLQKIKLTDFGIAKALDESVEGNLTSTGMILGTPYYVDPERVRGEPPVKESDVYSLGAAFFKMATGVPPVQGNSPLDTIGQIGSEKEFKWPRTIRSEISEGLEDLMMMMVSKNPKKRLGTHEVRDLLDHLLQNDLVLYQEPTPVQRKEARGRMRRLRRRIGRLRRGGRESAAELYAACSELSDLLPRDSAEGVNARIDALEEGLTHHRALGDSEKDRPALLEKKVALEARRLEERKFQRIVRRPKRLGRKALAGLALAAVLTLAGLFVYGKACEWRQLFAIDQSLAQARQALSEKKFAEVGEFLADAREKAKELPPASSKVKEIDELSRRRETALELTKTAGLLAEIDQHMSRREFFQAARKLESALKIPPSPESGELRVELERLQRLISPYLADLTVFAGLMETLEQVRAECGRIKAEQKGGRAPKAERVYELLARLSGIQLKLRDPRVINPDAVGSDLAQGLEEIDAVVSDLQQLR